jgi:hypothetical protein
MRSSWCCGRALAVFLLVGGELGFDFFQLRFQLVCLLGQEFSSLGGPFGSGLDVLVEKQCDQVVGNSLGNFRLAMLEGELEGDGSLALAPGLDVGANRLDKDLLAHFVDLFGHCQ